MSNKELPAFPVNYIHDNNTGNNFNSYEDGLGGLSKREYIAAMCYQGMLSNGQMIDTFAESALDTIAIKSVQAADFLIAHLENSSNG